MTWLIASLFILLGLGCIFLVIMQLPGTWLMLILGLGAQLLDVYVFEASTHASYGWWALGIGLVVAILGEVAESMAGVVGTKAGGGTKRGMVGAFIGGLAGAIGGSFLIPIPVVGTLIGAIVGTFIGAVIGETSGESPKSVSDSIKPAVGASLGRILGTTIKMICAMIVWTVVSAGLIGMAVGS
ncbi:MAG: DUF456 domain-containing protein [Planctomycetota bacterium]|nr:DUF456 domain-containing protein [Planctomycetota bacterium]